MPETNVSKPRTAPSHCLAQKDKSPAKPLSADEVKQTVNTVVPDRQKKK